MGINRINISLWRSATMNGTLFLLMVLALIASTLWAAAYLTNAVSYTVLELFGFVYASSITLGLLVIGRFRKS